MEPWEHGETYGYGVLFSLLSTTLRLVGDGLRLAILGGLLAGSHCLLAHGLGSLISAKIVAAVTGGAQVGGCLGVVAPVALRAARVFGSSGDEWNEPVAPESVV